MTLDGRTIELLSPIYVKLPDVLNRKEAQVVEINERMKAVKLMIMIGRKGSQRGKSIWVHVSTLSWSAFDSVKT